MTVPTPLPESGQPPNWAPDLLAGIESRYLANREAIDAVEEGLPAMGTAGLAVLAASLPAEAREVLGITVDTSVGTRVFVGGVMVYGDTGWRDVSSMLAPGLALSSSFGRAKIRRTGTRVEFDLKVDVTAAGITGIFSGVIPGFNPIPDYPMDNSIFTATSTGAGASALQSGTHAGVFYPTGTPLRTGSSTPWPNPGTVAWTSSYATNAPWPTSLPGTPV